MSEVTLLNRADEFVATIEIDVFYVLPDVIHYQSHYYLKQPNEIYRQIVFYDVDTKEAT